MGTHRVQLPEAERQGVTVVTNCRVERLDERAVVAVVSEAPVGEPSAWAPGEYRIRAKAVVAAGGAIGSPALLLRSPVAARAAGPWPLLHVPSGAHPRGPARPPDHELPRTSEELLLRSLRRVGRLPARNLHVLPVHDGEEPDRLRGRPRADDVGDGPVADDPRARDRPSGGREPRDAGRGRPAPRPLPLHRWRAPFARAGHAGVGAHLLRRRRHARARAGRADVLSRGGRRAAD